MASTLRRTMFTRPHHSPFTRAFAWAAVTAAALFGTAFALSSPALAQEDAPPDTTTEPGETTDDPTDEPTTTPDEADPSKKSQEDAEESDDVTAQVEPDFGYNKFRVGVQLEDPSEADGLTTLGSEITITETGPDVPGGEFVTTCTTTLEDPSEPTTTSARTSLQTAFRVTTTSMSASASEALSGSSRPAERRSGDRRRHEDRRAVWRL